MPCLAHSQVTETGPSDQDVARNICIQMLTYTVPRSACVQETFVSYWTLKRRKRLGHVHICCHQNLLPLSQFWPLPLEGHQHTTAHNKSVQWGARRKGLQSEHNGCRWSGQSAAALTSRAMPLQVASCVGGEELSSGMKKKCTRRTPTSARRDMQQKVTIDTTGVHPTPATPPCKSTNTVTQNRTSHWRCWRGRRTRCSSRETSAGKMQ